VKKSTATAAMEKTDSKIIWIFTNQEDPTISVSNPNEKDILITAAKDVIDNGQDIKLWELPKKGRGKFDRSVFYDEIIEDDDYDDSAMIQLEDGSPVPVQQENYKDGANLDLENLLEQIGRRWKNIRKMQSIPLLLPDWKLHGQVNHRKESDTGDEDKDDNGNDRNNTDAYPGIMLDLYQIIRVKRRPAAVTIDSRTNK
jgi:hypothetical protein